VSDARKLETLTHGIAQIDNSVGDSSLSMSGSAGTKNLFDSFQQAIAVSEHVVVKLAALVLVDVSSLQRFQIEAN
jgi:hypothetical protein